MYKINKKLKVILPMAMLCIAFLAYVLLEREGIFLFAGDSFEQVYQFYAGGYTRFFSGELFSYDFSTCFGQNPMYHSYYFLFSPFFYLSLLFPKEYLHLSFLFTTCVKLCTLYFSMIYWLKKLSRNETFVICFSLLFTFSGWTFFYSNYIFFLDHLFMLPLILASIEDYLNKEKSWPLVVCVAYLAVANYYFAYLFLAISCFYGICRAVCLKKSLLKKGFGFLIRIVLGLGIAAVVFLPNVMIVLNSPRLGAEIDFSMMNKYEIFKFISGFFIPTTYRFDSGLLVAQQWTRYLGWGNGCNAYMGVLAVYGLCLSLVSKKSKKLLIVLVFLGLGFVFYLFPVFSIMFQGTLDTRWFLYFHVFFCLLFSEVFEQDFSKKQIVISSILSIGAFASVLLISRFYGLTDSESLKQCCIIFGFYSIIILGYMAVLLLKRRQLLISLVCIEILFSGACFFFTNETLEPSWFLEEYTDSSLFDAYDDGSFYRILQDGYDYWPSNNSYAKDIRGVSFYSSVYNAEMDEYLSRFKTTWSMPAAPGQDLAYSLASVKYWVTKAYNYSEPYGYSFLEAKDEYTIYQNDYYVELGYGLKETIHPNALEDCSYFEQDLIMQKHLVTESSDNMDYEITGVTEGYHASIDQEVWLYASPEGKDKAISDTILVIENEKSNDVTIELYFYGQLMESYTYYERPYFTIPLSETDYVTDIRIVNLNEHDAEISTSVLDTACLDEWILNRQNNSFKNTEVSKNRITGEISVDEDMLVVVSIPYDEGWSVLVDGQPVEIEKVNLGFIGFTLDEGAHAVEMNYEIPHMKLGALISLSALAVCIFLVWKKGKMKCYNKID